MPNKIYPNKAVSKEIVNQLLTNKNLMGMITINTDLVDREGMTVEINRYSYEGNGQVLTKGQGNSTAIQSTYGSETYRVELYQARSQYYDEDGMEDGMVPTVCIRGVGTDIANHLMSGVITELGKATAKVYSATPDFNAFVDATGAVVSHNDDDGNEGLWGLCSKATAGKIRKALKDDLKYVEANAREGYIGTVVGINIVVSKAMPDDKVFIFDREAVTHFMKEDVSTEVDRDVNTRSNWFYGREYGFTALTAEGNKHASVLVIGTDPRTGYTLLNTAPQNWSTNYNDYYTYNATTGEMVKNAFDAAPTFVADTFYSKN